jgi:dephospho-CoA kinase
MLTVGLTGGIGAGKSAVAGRLAELGAVIVDSDVLAREVVAPGTPGLAAVAAEFGGTVLDAAGALDRARLAELVFADGGARRRLEGIVHPLVRARSAELIAAAPPGAVVVNDVPLLVEVGLAPTYHLVVVVEADPEVRVARLVGRGLAAGAARARIAAQASDERRRAAADVLLDNSGSRDALRSQVDALWAGRLVPYERNVRDGRAVWPPAELRVVDPDPAWPARYRRIEGRLRHAVGDRALRIDHIGSTAVPGLPAKDVIDVQLVVADLVAADRIAGQLAAAGYPRFAPEQWSGPVAGPAVGPAVAPSEPVKRFHGGADPADLVQVHVRSEASPWWRRALVFRDLLRAEPAEREAYALLKRQLAARGTTTTEYAHAKDPWLDGALGRAERWAADTGWQVGS